jgi:hypothetical protein
MCFLGVFLFFSLLMFYCQNCTSSALSIDVASYSSLIVSLTDTKRNSLTRVITTRAEVDLKHVPEAYQKRRRHLR